MKRKIFNVLFALVLVLSFSLVMAVPAAANGIVYAQGHDFRIAEDGTAEWSTTQVSAGSYSVELCAGSTPGVETYSYGRVNLYLTTPVALSALSGDPTFLAYGVVEGDPWNSGPYLNILLDTNSDGIYDDGLEGVVATSADGYAAGWHEMAGVDYYDADDSLETGEGYVDELNTANLTYWQGKAPTATVVGVQIMLGMSSHTDVGQVVYIDDVTIGEDTYAMEPRVINTTQTAGFNTIQAAIDAADPGDTITVAAGTYNENVVINKAITIQSVSGAATTIIDAGGGAGPVVDITSNGVTFDGFTTQNAGGVTVYGIDMDGVSGCTVKNCVVKNISGTTYAFGLHLINSNSNTLSNIAVSDLSETVTAVNHGAFGAWVTLSDNNTFTGITISSITAESDAQGVMLYNGADGNSFTGTAISALTTTGSGTLVYPVGVTVWSGAAPCNGNTFTDTTISDINTGADGWAAGVQDRGDSLGNTGNTYTNTDINDIDSTGKAYGVVVATGSSVTFNGGSIQNINATTSAWGFEIRTASAASITNMTISVGEGVRIAGGTDASLSSIHSCNIAGNTVYGINNLGTGTLDATCNWWGNVAGPFHEGPYANPYQQLTLTGDHILGDVIYTPWLIQCELNEGWNIWSMPIAGDPDSLLQMQNELVEAGIEAIYYFDSATQLWGLDPDAAGPLDAFYIKMPDDSRIRYYFSSEATFPPQKAMRVGWNFIGLAELYPRFLVPALSDAYWGTGVAAGLPGYNKVMCPSLNGDFWTYLRGGPGGFVLYPTKGYWVLMVNDGILGGFTSTPIVEIENT